MVAIRRMTTTDLASVAPAQARAFFDDPLQVWALPDASTRLATLETMFAVLTDVYTLPMGESYTDPTGSVAAFWIPPGRYGEAPSAAAQRALAEIDASLDASSGARLLAANNAMRAMHPHEPHWYLQGLGTDPAMQRRGLASAALAPVLTRADADGMPAYLESTKEGNISFYQHHGFVVTGTIAVPDGGPTMWTMWRAGVSPARSPA